MGATIYFGICTVVTVAILVALGVFVFRPFVDWGFDTYGNWAGLALLAIPALWAYGVWWDRFKARRRQASRARRDGPVAR